MGDRWEWEHDWARRDDVPDAADSWAHHSVAATADGEAVGVHARGIAVLDVVES
jgi:hypothetical protein